MSCEEDDQRILVNPTTGLRIVGRV
jgi:hypothetical protein